VAQQQQQNMGRRDVQIKRAITIANDRLAALPKQLPHNDNQAIARRLVQA